MIKYFCDACKNEITGNTDGSRYVFFEYKVEKGGAVPVQKEEIYCSLCTTNIKKTIGGLKPSKYANIA